MSTVTLNIETSSVRLLTAEGRRVEQWASMPITPGLVQDGIVLDLAKVGSIIDALFNSKQVPRDRVIVSLTGLRSVRRILHLPKMKSALPAEAIRRGVKREMPVPLDELYLSWCALKAVDAEQQFFVLGVPQNILDAQVQALKQSGIRPSIMDLKPLALARAVRHKEAVIIDLESESSDIIIVVDGIPAIMRTVIMRSERPRLEDKIGRLADELLRTVRFYNSSQPENPLPPTTPVFITGELANDPAVVQLIPERIEYPIKPLAPGLECPPDLPVPQYAVNIGLALKMIPQDKSPNADVADSDMIDLNILPDKYRGRWRPSSLLGHLFAKQD